VDCGGPGVDARARAVKLNEITLEKIQKNDKVETKSLGKFTVF
jgi:hypothetical protein